MSLDLTTIIEPDFLKVIASGEHSPEAMFGFIESIRAEADKAARKRVLVDSFNFSSPMSDAEKFILGRHLAEVFGSHIKAAILLPAEHITKIGELTAVNRGARLLVTSSESEAMAWLLS